MSGLGPGALVGEYQLSFLIGRGGMGQVWAARQSVGGRDRMLALKILPMAMLEAKLKALFLDEARVARALSHPNIVSAFDVGSDGDLLYMAMELIRGPSLSVLLQQLVRTRRILDPSTITSVGLDLLDALVHAHDEATIAGRPLKLVHRDVSPQNVLVRPGGSVALADFGVARSEIQTHETTAGTVRGKPAYMSPEQVASTTLDARSDLFSLGVVLYELAVLRRLFGRKNLLLTMQAVTNFDPPPIAQYRPDLPSALQRVIHRLLERKPADRFQSAADARLAMQEALPPAARGRGRVALWSAVTEALGDDAFDVVRHSAKALATSSDTEPDARPEFSSSSGEVAPPSSLPASQSAVEIWPTIAASHPLDEGAMTDAGWNRYFEDLEVAPKPRPSEPKQVTQHPAVKTRSVVPTAPPAAPVRVPVVLREAPRRASVPADVSVPLRHLARPAAEGATELPMAWIVGLSAVVLILGALYASMRKHEPDPVLDAPKPSQSPSGETAARAPVAPTQGANPIVHSNSPGTPVAASSSTDLPPGVTEDDETLHRRLILAVERGDVAAVKNGIKGGPGLARVDENGWTVLHVAAYRGQTQITEVLLEQGADPNTAAAEGWTPLHLAAQGGHVDAASTLLRHGGKPAATTNSGDTPMHVVAASKPNTADRMITLLVRHGAKADELDGKGFTPVDAAVDHDCFTCLEGFFRARAPLSQKAGDGVTPLWRAAYLGRTKIAGALLNKGAVAPRVDGVSASEIARQRGHLDLARVLAEHGQ